MIGGSGPEGGGRGRGRDRQLPRGLALLASNTGRGCERAGVLSQASGPLRHLRLAESPLHPPESGHGVEKADAQEDHLPFRPASALTDHRVASAFDAQ